MENALTSYMYALLNSEVLNCIIFRSGERSCEQEPKIVGHN